jgi:DNA-binding winged helix-turn-helix (wHTH) protein
MEGRSLHFGKFRLDQRSGELTEEGRTVRLAPQPTKLLLLLAPTPGALVTHEEIQRELWGEDNFVDFEQAVKKCAKQVRAALGDDALEPVYVETWRAGGARLSSGAHVCAEADNVPEDAPQSRLARDDARPGRGVRIAYPLRTELTLHPPRQDLQVLRVALGRPGHLRTIPHLSCFGYRRPVRRISWSRPRSP